MTVEEVLRQSGFSSEQIRAMEPRAITAFSGVLTTSEKNRQEAQAAREAAELAQRSNIDFYEGKIVPALTNWEEERSRIDNEKANAMAEAAFYRTQAEQARSAGFIPADAPGYQPPRDQQGRYVANVPGSTPGSPTYFDVNKVYERAGDAVGILTDIQWEHQRLTGSPMPISPTELVRRADAVKLDPRTYAAREFGWDAKRAEMQKKQEEAHDNKIRAERDQFWAEKVGSNPDVRMPQASRYAENQRAVRAGTLPDPLQLGEAERRQATRAAIRADMVEAEK